MRRNVLVLILSVLSACGSGSGSGTPDGSQNLGGNGGGPAGNSDAAKGTDAAAGGNSGAGGDAASATTADAQPDLQVAAPNSVTATFSEVVGVNGDSTKFAAMTEGGQVFYQKANEMTSLQAYLQLTQTRVRFIDLQLIGHPVAGNQYKIQARGVLNNFKDFNPGTGTVTYSEEDLTGATDNGGWDALSGTLTIDAFAGDVLTMHASALPMAKSSDNFTPLNNKAQGTFKLDVLVQAVTVQQR